MGNLSLYLICPTPAYLLVIERSPLSWSNTRKSSHECSSKTKVLNIISVYMDSPTACGRTFPAGDREVFIVKPRGTVGVSNPPTQCIVTFESSYSSNNYNFEIVVESAQFQDCSMELRVFNGASAGGTYEVKVPSIYNNSCRKIVFVFSLN